MEKAMEFQDKIEKKTVDTSKNQEAIKVRSRDWDQVNESVMCELYRSDERVADLVQGML